MRSDNAIRLGNNIAERRKQLALTPEMLAQRANVDAETIVCLERGAGRLTMEILKKLATALNVTDLELLRKLPAFPKPKGGEKDVTRRTRVTPHDAGISGRQLTATKYAK